MTKLKKVVMGISVLVLVGILVSGLTLYATNGLNKTLNKQLTVLFNTPGRLTKTFNNTDSRYTINYPVDWEVDQTAKGTVVFSGREGARSFMSSINIQVVLTKKMKGEYATVDEFIKDIKQQVKGQSTNASFLDEGAIEIKEKDGLFAKGKYIVFTYEYSGMMIKQWQIVVLRADDQVFYAWAYTSSVDEYETDLPIAKEMLSSWMIY